MDGKMVKVQYISRTSVSLEHQRDTVSAPWRSILKLKANKEQAMGRFF